MTSVIKRHSRCLCTGVRILGLAILLIAQLALAQELPLNPPEFTTAMAERVKELAATDAQLQLRVTISRPLALRLSAPSGVAVEVTLSALHAQCTQAEGRCSQAADGLARAAFAAFAEATSTPTRDMLRVVLRPEAYVSRASESLKQRGLGTLVAKPYVGELWILVVMSRPGLMGLATADILKQLGLDEAAAYEIALKNTRGAKAPALESAMPLRGTHFHAIAEDDYESSRLLFAEDWARIARQRGNDLFVSVPSSSQIIFTTGRENAQALREIAVQESRKAPRAVTAQIFRWKPDGWEVVRDAGDARAEADAPGVLRRGGPGSGGRTP